MPVFNFIVTTPIRRTARALQLEGLFDIPPSERSEQQWRVELPLEDLTWNVGLIVGPSGSGKTTLAREAFGLPAPHEWPVDASLVDGFPARMSVKEITGLLSSVGFSSPPSWLRPFRVLSNGEQFRATVARTLAEAAGLAVIDEFTSVVDRTVARIGSAAVAKTVRRRRQKLVAVSCHYDVVDWLQPDWLLEMPTGTFTRRSLQRRPDIILDVRRVEPDLWRLFGQHHYLSRTLNRAAKCFAAYLEGRPVAFTGVLYQPHANGGGWREHRTVCLPDFQGVGIGNALSEFVASLFRATGRPYYSVTSNPAMIHHRARSPLWHMHRRPARSHRNNEKNKSIRAFNATIAESRLAAGFRYVGPVRRTEALAFGIA